MYQGLKRMLGTIWKPIAETSIGPLHVFLTLLDKDLMHG